MIPSTRPQRSNTEHAKRPERSAQSSHRLSHPSADANNAPGDQTAGTWVRVAQAWAGSNWGGVFIPRVGQ
ncbi:MAG: hypothetical protein KA751_15215, partial [Comamonas sp.]|nr:hypothetical protein [Comamonas sp.]